MKKSVLPPMPNSLNFASRDLGSLDPFALRAQLPERSGRATAYDEISRLSLRTESLKQENELMQLDLLDLVSTQHDNSYCRMKHSLVEFSARLARREREVAEIRAHLGGKCDAPTFVEVDVHRDRQASFDLVATSLLVSNQQRTFFKAADLRRQNEELLALIEHQQDELRMVRARLQLYEKCQHTNSIRLKIDSLRRGEKPGMLADAAPDQIREQRMKIKMLSEELAGLVQQRKEMERMRGNRKTKQRANRRKRDMAVKIQSVFRGFMVRLQMKRLRMSAKKIQKCWREFRGKKMKEPEPMPEPEALKEPEVVTVDDVAEVDERQTGEEEEENVAAEDEIVKEEEETAEQPPCDSKSQTEEIAEKCEEEETEAEVEGAPVEQEETQKEEAIMTLDRM